MRIVLDARTVSDYFPGIGRYTASLAWGMAKVAPNQNILLLCDPSVPVSRLTLPLLPRIDCPVSPLSLRQQWAIPWVLHRNQASLYHSPYFMMPFIPGVPCVLTCHDLIPLVCSEYFSALQRLVIRVVYILTFKVARMIIAVSHATKADLIRYFSVDPQRIVVIPEAADSRFCPQSPERIAAVRTKYSLPEEYVLYLGVNKPHKNLRRLVEAWRISGLGVRNSGFGMRAVPRSPVPSPQSPIKLVIAGHWDERYPEAKRLVEESGLNDRVFFAGPIEDADLPALYSAAHLFVFPSLYEGFGLPVIEAMACGVPVICSKTSSLPEVGGDAALLMDPLDINSLARAISMVLLNEGIRQEMRVKGLAQAEKFSWELTAKKTLQVYAGILNSEK